MTEFLESPSRMNSCHHDTPRLLLMNLRNGWIHLFVSMGSTGAAVRVSCMATNKTVLIESPCSQSRQSREKKTYRKKCKNYVTYNRIEYIN